MFNHDSTFTKIEKRILNLFIITFCKKLKLTELFILDNKATNDYILTFETSPTTLVHYLFISRNNNAFALQVP